MQANSNVTFSLAEIQIPGSCQGTDPEVLFCLLVQPDMSFCIQQKHQRHALTVMTRQQKIADMNEVSAGPYMC